MGENNAAMRMEARVTDDTTSLETDVVVIGGGPAGTTVGSMLRESGRSVIILEKDRHPRFHIGESLLPRNIPILRKLGVLNDVKKIGVLKRGADFNDPGIREHMVFDFSNALAPDEPTAFQVRRDEFDHLLLRNAESRGVTVHQGTTVTDVSFPSDGPVSVRATSDDGRTLDVTAKFLVDASGRDTFMSGRLKLKERNANHNSAAVFGHFHNIPRRTGEEAGNISVYWFEHGWFWVIPLRDGRTSVGMVCWPYFLKTRDCALSDFLMKGASMNPALAERLKEAVPAGEITATGNFSYRSKSIFGDRYILVGDAFAFIDPVFSSGVYLAMQGGEFAARAVEGCLAEPNRASHHLARYERQVAKGINKFSWFIYRFTSPTMRFLFMNPSDHWYIKSAVISILSGDVYRRLPKRLPLLLFKTIYYTLSLLKWRESSPYRQRLR